MPQYCRVTSSTSSDAFTGFGFRIVEEMIEPVMLAEDICKTWNFIEGLNPPGGNIGTPNNTSRLFKGLVPNTREVSGTCGGGLGAPGSGSRRLIVPGVVSELRPRVQRLV